MLGGSNVDAKMYGYFPGIFQDFLYYNDYFLHEVCVAVIHHPWPLVKLPKSMVFQHFEVSILCGSEHQADW